MYRENGRHGVAQGKMWSLKIQKGVVHLEENENYPKSADSLLQWIKANKESWQLICLADGAEIRPEEYVRLLKELQKEKLYPVVILLLTKGTQVRFIEEAIAAACITRSGGYDARDVDRLIWNLECKLKDEKQE